MVIPSPDAGQTEPEPIRDVARLVLEHPIPVYDPGWLRELHGRCLWDGGPRRGPSDFCSAACEERYAEWEHRTTHVVLGREPIQTLLEQGGPLPQ